MLTIFKYNLPYERSPTDMRLGDIVCITGEKRLGRLTILYKIIEVRNMYFDVETAWSRTEKYPSRIMPKYSHCEKTLFALYTGPIPPK